MLKNEISYKLDEFVIIEQGGVLLTWVKHMPFGSQRSGKCYRLDNILVILPWDHEGPGFLKWEFNEYSMKLPRWTKTHYYCFASTLRQVGIAQSLSTEAIRQIAGGESSHELVKVDESRSFQLNRYKITLHNNNIISWLTIGGFNKTIGGTCFIESDIIFLGPQENESDTKQRRLFFAEFKLLPLWNKTVAWGHAGSLKICEKFKNQKSSYSAAWNPEPTKVSLKDNINLLQSEGLNKEKFREIKESGIDWLKKIWTRVYSVVR
ncbi:MAG: hypothetical protein WBB23_07645 [Desulforhopalus sp.]